MAKHRKSYGLSGVADAFAKMNKSVKISDVYAGAALAFLGNVAVNALDYAATSKEDAAAGKSMLFGWLPSSVVPIVKPLLSSAVIGGVLYAVSSKKPERAYGHLAGALAVGIGSAAKGAVQAGVNAAMPSLPESVKPWVKLDGVPVYLNGVPIQINGVQDRPYTTHLTPVRMLNGVPVMLAAGRTQLTTVRQGRTFDSAVP